MRDGWRGGGAQPWIDDKLSGQWAEPGSPAIRLISEKIAIRCKFIHEDDESDRRFAQLELDHPCRPSVRSVSHDPDSSPALAVAARAQFGGL